MARFEVKLDTAKLAKQINAIMASQSVRKEFKKQVEPVIKETINSAVEQAKIHFQPHKIGGEELIGKLGVGKDGAPDYEKLENAYKLLQVGTASTKFFISAAKTNFAGVKYEINKDVFYSAFQTNYLSRSAGGTQEIPWMKFHLQGMATNPGYTFIGDGDAEFDLNAQLRSRTGLGLMVSRTYLPGFAFSLPPYGEDVAYGAIFAAIKKNLNSSTIKSKINAALAKAISNA
jgi:hypothetical protein